MADTDSITARTRRGYLLMAALLIAAVVVFNADGLADLTRGHLDVVALVPRAEGIRTGSAVWVAGVESGRVTRIGFAAPRAGVASDSPAVAIHLRLDDHARALVTRASDVRAIRLRFIGQPVVEIDPGVRGDAPIRDGDTLHGRPTPDPMEVLNRGERLTASVDSLTRAFRRVQDRADRRAPEIDRLTGRLVTVAAAAGTLSAHLDSGSLGRMLDPDSGLPERVAALQARLDGLREAGDRLLRRYDPAGTDTAAGVPGAAPDPALAPAMKRLLARAESLDRELDALRTTVDTGQGFLVRVQQDSALQVAVRGVQAQIDSLTADAVSVGLRMLLPRP